MCFEKNCCGFGRLEMLPRWSRAITLICKSAAARGDVEKLRCGGFNVFTCRGLAKVADAVPDFGTDDGSAVGSQVLFCFVLLLVYLSLRFLLFIDRSTIELRFSERCSYYSRGLSNKG